MVPTVIMSFLFTGQLDLIEKYLYVVPTVLAVDEKGQVFIMDKMNNTVKRVISPHPYLLKCDIIMYYVYITGQLDLVEKYLYVNEKGLLFVILLNQMWFPL